MSTIRALWATEPVRVLTLLTAVIVFAAAKLGVIIDEQNVGEALTLVLPILLGGEAARHRVSPAPDDVGPASDALLADVQVAADPVSGRPGRPE